jgi:hypothetical protein
MTENAKCILKRLKSVTLPQLVRGDLLSPGQPPLTTTISQTELTAIYSRLDRIERKIFSTTFKK